MSLFAPFHSIADGNLAGANLNYSRPTFMRKIVFTVSLLFGILQSAPAEPVLPEYILTLPVQIRIPIPNGTNYGTGSYLLESNKIFLITDAHVIFNQGSTNKAELIGPEALLSTYAPEVDSTNRTLVTLTLKQALAEGLLKRHSDRDIACVRMATRYSRTNGSTYIVWNHIVGSTNKSSVFRSWDTPDGCKLFNSTPDAGEAYILGYRLNELKRVDKEDSGGAPSCYSRLI